VDTVLEFGILGPLLIEGDDGELSVPGVRRRALLVRLLTSANQPVSAKRLAEDLWDGSPPPGANSTLQSHISFLRRTLGGNHIRHHDGGYVLELGDAVLDAHAFEAESEEGRRAVADGDNESAAAKLQNALARWRGSPLADANAAGWAIPEITRLEQLRLSTFEAWHEALLSLGRHHEVAASAGAAVVDHPFREGFWSQLMLALYRSGRQADALRAYQRLRTCLNEELGIDPSPMVVALEHAILNQAPELTRPHSSGIRELSKASSGNQTASSARLVHNETAAEAHRLTISPMSIGRDPENDISLPGDLQASRHHADLEFLNGGWVLRDTDSHNGTFVNGHRCVEQPLRGGDQIRIGWTTFTFVTDESLATMTDYRLSDRTVATTVFISIDNSFPSDDDHHALGSCDLEVKTLISDLATDWSGEATQVRGDGLATIFESAQNALAFAVSLRHQLSLAGVSLRAGIHAGEIERTDDEINGFGVRVARELLIAAGDRQILVSRTVRDAIVDPDLVHEYLGTSVLEGLPGTWELFSITGQ